MAKLQVDLGPLESARMQFSLETPREQQNLPGEIMRARALRLALRGMNATKAAAMLGCAPHTARKIYADPNFQREVRKRVDLAFVDVDSKLLSKDLSLHERLERKALEAFEVLAGMLDDANTHPGYRMRIAQDFLDRNPETQGGSTVRYGRLDPSQLREAANAARDMDNVVPIKRPA